MPRSHDVPAGGNRRLMAVFQGPAAGAITLDVGGREGGGEEVTTALPRLGVRVADQAEVRLVDQGGGLEGLAWFLLRQLLSGQLA